VLADGQSIGQIKRIASQFAFPGADQFFQHDIRTRSDLEPLGCLGDLGWYNIRFTLWAMNWELPARVAGQCNERGQVVAKPASITPHTKFKAEVYVLKKEEGGRHTPFFPGYRPQFYFRTTDVTGIMTLPEGVEMVMPGDNISTEVHLINPVALEKELRFAIREGGRTVGAGVLTEVIE